MFTAEALELIQETAQKATAVELLAIEDPRQHHVRVGENLTTIEKAPPLRNHHADSIESFCKIVNTLPIITGRPGTAGDIQATVWHSPDKLVALFDDADRRDVVTCRLTPSRQVVTLAKIDRRPLNQREFCRTLKLELGVPETWIGQFRRLDWSSANEATTETRRGADRLGAAIRAEVSGIDKLPEELTLQIPLYETDGARATYSIRCLIEIDPDPNARTITLATTPGEIQAATDSCQADIAEMLDLELEKGTPVFYGTP